MTKTISAFTFVAAATFATLVALDGAIFPVASASATRPAIQATIPGFDVNIIPIEELKGPPPDLCALEVCSTNVPSRPKA